MRSSHRRGRTVDGLRYALQARQLAPGSIRNYVQNAKAWLNWCEEHELDYREATREDITYHLGEMSAVRRQTTVKFRFLSIRIFYDYVWALEHGIDYVRAVQDKLVDYNPARQIAYKNAQARDTEPFTEDELRRMFDACLSYRERAIFLLSLGGGLRRTEIYNITRQDINLAAKTIAVLGKGNQYRLISPGQPVLDALCHALEFEDRLCPVEQKKPGTIEPYARGHYVYHVIRQLAKRAGVKGRVYPHRFRHTFASSYLDAGGTVEELQQILGHKRIEQSLFYAKAGRQKRALEAQARINIAGRLLGPLEQVERRGVDDVAG
jgi:site-specific recombinase XerD